MAHNEEMDDLVAAVDADADELEIDLSEAKEFSVIEGKRRVEVIDTKRGVSKEKKEPFIELKMKVIDDEDTNRVVFKMLMLKGGGAGITKRYLTALGAGIDWDAPRISPAALVGLKGIATLGPDPREEYKHKTVVKDISPDEDPDAVASDELA